MSDIRSGCRITGTGLFTPPESISNQELVESFNAHVDQFNLENAVKIASGEIGSLEPSSVEFIEKASGIKSRHVVNKSGLLDINLMHPSIAERDDDQPSIQCEMAVIAAEQALSQAGKTAADIDFVVCACSNMQRPYPAVAIEVQNALGIKGYAYDLNVACSSATFGIQAATDAISNGHAKAVLMVNPEICTAHNNMRDRNSHFIFGDATTAVVIESVDTASESGFDIIGSHCSTDFSNNIRNNFGFLNAASPLTRLNDDKLFYQQGKRVFKEVVPAVIKLIQTALEKMSVAVDDIKRLWLHQANRHMNDMIAAKILGHEVSRVEAPLILDEYANTSSAGSIIAFHLHSADMKSGDIGVICSFGAGYSLGAVVVRKV